MLTCRHGTQDQIGKLRTSTLQKEVQREVLFSLEMEKTLIEEVNKCNNVEGLKRVAETLNNEKHGYLWQHAIFEIRKRIDLLSIIK